MANGRFPKHALVVPSKGRSVTYDQLDGIIREYLLEHNAIKNREVRVAWHPHILDEIYVLERKASTMNDRKAALEHYFYTLHKELGRQFSALPINNRKAPIPWYLHIVHKHLFRRIQGRFRIVRRKNQ